MPDSKLPPGPWKATMDDPPFDGIAEFRDATARRIIWVDDEGTIAMAPDIACAIEALPLLVAAARVMAAGFVDWKEKADAFASIRAVLAMIDKEPA